MLVFVLLWYFLESENPSIASHFHLQKLLLFDRSSLRADELQKKQQNEPEKSEWVTSVD